MDQSIYLIMETLLISISSVWNGNNTLVKSNQIRLWIFTISTPSPDISNQPIYIYTYIWMQYTQNTSPNQQKFDTLEKLLQEHQLQGLRDWLSEATAVWTLSIDLEESDFVQQRCFAVFCGLSMGYFQLGHFQAGKMLICWDADDPPPKDDGFHFQVRLSQTEPSFPTPYQTTDV